MNLSLAVTTFNRAHCIERALASIAALELPANFQAEVLVVDNNSTDSTAELLAKVQAGWQGLPLRLLAERRQGLSHARNCALAAARGEWIAYMDDDQTIAADYLVEFARTRARTRADVIGGRVLYQFDAPLPDWLPPLIRTVGQIDLGDAVLSLQTPPQFLKGGNIAFRRDKLAQVGGFDPRLGRIGASLLAGEEDDVQLRMVRQGSSIQYWPGLVQYNELPPGKRKKSYWRRHAFGWGATQTLSLAVHPALPWWRLRSAATAVWHWLSASRKQRFEAELDVWAAAGAIIQGWRDPRRGPIRADKRPG